MYTRGERIAQGIFVGLAVLIGAAVASAVLRGGEAAAPSAAPSLASPTPRPPQVNISLATCCEQTARFIRASWTSSAAVRSATVALAPDPPFACTATVDATGAKGTFGCAGLLRGATDYVAKLSLGTDTGIFVVEQRFRTMGDRLSGVRWFTEFEDPTGDPLACAAASCRIIQLYAAGQDPMTATQILAFGQQFNRSRDPGIDPAAIATVLTRLDPRDRYHYYRFATREEATKASVYWLLRSGKPVMVMSLAGQHGPLVIGFNGAFGTFYDDPVDRVEGLLIEDPQRGDLRPETANHRPDKYRALDFQTGRLIGLDEWYGDEWWLRFAYQAVIRMPDASLLNVERNDGVYPTPHWGGTFVILADDADADNPPEREGRVVFR